MNTFGRNCLIYEGEFLNGKRNGYGKEYDTIKQLIFEGIFLNGKQWNGKGVEFHCGRVIYEGEFLHGERNGKGEEYNLKGDKILEGEFLKGKRNGEGKEYYGVFPNKLKFEGVYLNGELISKTNINK